METQIALSVQEGKGAGAHDKKKKTGQPEDFSFLTLFNTVTQSFSPASAKSVAPKGIGQLKNSQHNEKSKVGTDQISEKIPPTSGKRSDSATTIGRQISDTAKTHEAILIENPQTVIVGMSRLKKNEVNSKNQAGSAQQSTGKQVGYHSGNAQSAQNASTSVLKVNSDHASVSAQIKSDLATLINAHSDQAQVENSTKNSFIASRIADAVRNDTEAKIPSAKADIHANVVQPAALKMGRLLRAADNPATGLNLPEKAESTSDQAPSKTAEPALTSSVRKVAVLPLSQVAARQMSHTELFVSFTGTAQRENSNPVSTQVSDQMVKWMGKSSFRLDPGGTKNLTVTLYPEHLGKLTVSVTQTSDGMIARIIAGTKTAKDLLESGIGQLRNDLAAQGVTIGQIDVSRQWQSAAAGESQNMNQQQTNQDTNGQSGGKDDESKQKKSARPVDGNNAGQSFLEWMTGGVPST
ncbi:flagellar hook-length control protein FliK [Sporolactobacillus shoreae]|uniref:Flagellar hook-length control protein FliK n=1 Tax=Sporolactobacillus shoreae TaxID=1465501 RepID=A0A4Z0GSB3_9BACL|nr:flagellar hook-length control protein FliK [Sporolactobacillus shoreae]TGB00284.1 flagellar hook-length control protein FliK [Sporolactobacillus shoreae]